MARPFAISMRMQRLYFDRPSVIRQIGRKQAKGLNRAGMLTRQRARKLLGKKRKRGGTSKPGKPPYVHTSDDRVSLRNVQYYFDPTTTSVIIGPVKLNQVQQSWIDSRVLSVPEVLEKGDVLVIREVSTDQGKTWRRRDLRRNARPTDQFRKRRAIYKPRPWMGPAQRDVAPKVPYLFADDRPMEGAA